MMNSARSIRQDAQSAANRAEAAAQRVRPSVIIVMDVDGPAAAPAVAAPAAPVAVPAPVAPVAAPAPAAQVAVPPAAQPVDAPLIGRHSLRSSFRNVRPRNN
jgi:hypothetical protein